MRGLVMEVKGNTLIVLTAQGKYIRMKNDGSAAIGDFVPCNHPLVSPARWIRMPANAMAFAASLLLFCTAGLGAYAYSTPFGTVNIDINPSLTLTYNWFQQVIDVEALNADAEKLLTDMNSLKNKPVPEAVEAVVAAASQAGYLEPELANVVFVSVSDRSSLVRTAGLLDAIEQDLSQRPEKTETVLFAGSAKNFEQVREKHESPKEELIETSLDDEPENDPPIHSSKPLKEILEDQKEQKEKKHEKTEPESDDHPSQNNAPEKDKPNTDKQKKNELKENENNNPDNTNDQNENPGNKPEESDRDSEGDADKPSADFEPEQPIIVPELLEDLEDQEDQENQENQDEDEQELSDQEEHEEQEQNRENN